MNKNRLNSIASTLLWLWGILIVLIGLAIGIPAFATQGTSLPILVFGVWGVVICASAYALRKRKWGVRWWATALCVVSTAIMILAQNRLSLLGMAINIGAIALVLFSWNLPVVAQPEV